MARKPIILKIFSNKILDGIFILAVLFVLFLPLYNYMKENETSNKTAPSTMESLHIFIPNGPVKLAEKKMDINMGMSEKQKADMIINELKRQQYLPARLTLYDFAVDEDGVMYMNFSTEILNSKIGAGQEITTTYAIVNSFLLNFKGINKIQILAEGNPAQTINGVINIYKPMEFNKTLLED